MHPLCPAAPPDNRIIYSIAGVCGNWTPVLAEGQAATSAALPSMPRKIALASNGDLYVEMNMGCSVHRVSAATGAFTTVVGENGR